MGSGRENPGSSRISASSAAGTASSSRRRPSSAYASQKRSSTAQREPTAWRTRRNCPGETKCGMSTNGIVRPAKTTSCSASHRSICSSIPAHWSPSLESSTRCWSFRLLTWSITLSSPMSRVLRTLPARMRPVYYLGVCFPIAVVLELVHANPVLVFSAAALAVIPCAAVMGEATEAIAVRTGPGIGGLLNVTFGNAPELIIAFFALIEGLQEVVKASIVGSVIGNVLLVLLSFVFGPDPMALVFNGYEISALVFAVLIANFVTQEGESNWFEGVQLLALYAVLGLVFYFA